MSFPLQSSEPQNVTILKRSEDSAAVDPERNTMAKTKKKVRFAAQVLNNYHDSSSTTSELDCTNQREIESDVKLKDINTTAASVNNDLVDNNDDHHSSILISTVVTDIEEFIITWIGSGKVSYIDDSIHYRVCKPSWLDSEEVINIGDNVMLRAPPNNPGGSCKIRYYDYLIFMNYQIIIISNFEIQFYINFD